jgi:xylan 1,4-beta-xylosidase
VDSSSGLDAQTILKSGVRGPPDVSALASLDKNKLAVLIWHYHDDDVPGPDAQVDLALNNLPLSNGKAQMTRFIIDSNHGNAYAAWKRMGSPQPLSDKQFRKLEQAGQLAALGRPEILRAENGSVTVKLNLPRQAVALLVVDWK